MEPVGNVVGSQDRSHGDDAGRRNRLRAAPDVRAPEALGHYGARNREQALAQRAWQREASGDLDEAWYHEQVAPQLVP